MKLESVVDQHGNTIFFKRGWPENCYVIANGNGTYQVVSNGNIMDSYKKIEDAVKVVDNNLP